MSNRFASISTKNYRISQNKILSPPPPPTPEVIVPWSKFSQSVDYLAKQGQIQINTIMRTNSKYNSQKKNQSTTLTILRQAF